MNEEFILELYDKLAGKVDGLEMGTIDEFTSSMQEEGGRQQFYDDAMGSGAVEFGSFGNFSNKLGVIREPEVTPPEGEVAPIETQFDKDLTRREQLVDEDLEELADPADFEKFDSLSKDEQKDAISEYFDVRNSLELKRGILNDKIQGTQDVTGLKADIELLEEIVANDEARINSLDDSQRAALPKLKARLAENKAELKAFEDSKEGQGILKIDEQLKVMADKRATVFADPNLIAAEKGEVYDASQQYSPSERGAEVEALRKKADMRRGMSPADILARDGKELRLLEEEQKQNIISLRDRGLDVDLATLDVNNNDQYNRAREGYALREGTNAEILYKATNVLSARHDDVLMEGRTWQEAVAVVRARGTTLIARGQKLQDELSAKVASGETTQEEAVQLYNEGIGALQQEQEDMQAKLQPLLDDPDFQLFIKTGDAQAELSKFREKVFPDAIAREAKVKITQENTDKFWEEGNVVGNSGRFIGDRITQVRIAALESLALSATGLASVGAEAIGLEKFARSLRIGDNMMSLVSTQFDINDLQALIPSKYQGEFIEYAAKFDDNFNMVFSADGRPQFLRNRETGARTNYTQAQAKDAKARDLGLEASRQPNFIRAVYGGERSMYEMLGAILLTKGAGSALKITGQAAKMGVFAATSAFQMFGREFTAKLAEGKDPLDAAGEAMGNSAITGLLESMVGGLEGRLISKELLSEGLKKNLRTGLANTVRLAIKNRLSGMETRALGAKFMKEWVGDNVGGEIVEELAQDLAVRGLESARGNEDFKMLKSDEFWNIAATTMAATILPGFFSARRAALSKKGNIVNTILYSASQDEAEFAKVVGDLRDTAAITQGEAEFTLNKMGYLRDELGALGPEITDERKVQSIPLYLEKQQLEVALANFTESSDPKAVEQAAVVRKRIEGLDKALDEFFNKDVDLPKAIKKALPEDEPIDEDTIIEPETPISEIEGIPTPVADTPATLDKETFTFDGDSWVKDSTGRKVRSKARIAKLNALAKQPGLFDEKGKTESPPGGTANENRTKKLAEDAGLPVEETTKKSEPPKRKEFTEKKKEGRRKNVAKRVELTKESTGKTLFTDPVEGFVTEENAAEVLGTVQKLRNTEALTPEESAYLDSLEKAIESEQGVAIVNNEIAVGSQFDERQKSDPQFTGGTGTNTGSFITKIFEPQLNKDGKIVKPGAMDVLANPTAAELAEALNITEADAQTMIDEAKEATEKSERRAKEAEKKLEEKTEKKPEEKTRKERKSKGDSITGKQWKEFVDKESVNITVLQAIANKIANGVKLTKREIAVSGFFSKTIEDLLQKKRLDTLNERSLEEAVPESVGSQVSQRKSRVAPKKLFAAEQIWRRNENGDYVDSNGNLPDARQRNKLAEAFKAILEVQSESSIPATRSMLMEQLTNVRKALSSIAPDVRIVILNDDDFFREVGTHDAGQFVNNTIFVNADFAKSTTMYHEAAHAIFLRFFAIDSPAAILVHEAIARALTSTGSSAKQRAIGRRVNGFINNYKNDISLTDRRSHEFFAELTGMLSANKQFIKAPNIVKKLVAGINDAVEKLMGFRPLKEYSDIDDIIDFTNTLAGNLGSGEVITTDIIPDILKDYKNQDNPDTAMAQYADRYAFAQGTESEFSKMTATGEEPIRPGIARLSKTGPMLDPETGKQAKDANGKKLTEPKEYKEYLTYFDTNTQSFKRLVRNALSGEMVIKGKSKEFTDEKTGKVTKKRAQYTVVLPYKNAAGLTTLNDLESELARLEKLTAKGRVREHRKNIPKDKKTDFAKRVAANVINKEAIVRQKELIRDHYIAMAAEFQNAIVEVLRAQMDAIDPTTMVELQQWYEGANRLLNNLADTTDYSIEQVGAVMAAFSPTNPWFNNLTNGERAITIHRDRQDTILSEEDLDKVLARLSKESAFYAKLKKFKNKIAGRTFREVLADTDLAGFQMEASKIQGVTVEVAEKRDVLAVFFMAIDATHNPQDYNAYRPNGSMGGTFKSKNGAPTKAGFINGNANIIKALSVLEDGSIENVDRVIGRANKVRNFYNNMVDPANPKFVTIDTHAFGNMLGAWTNADMAGGFGVFLPDNGMAYALGKDAFLQIGQEYGIIGRGVQSILWEAVRAKWNDIAPSGSDENTAIAADLNKRWRGLNEDGSNRADIMRQIMIDYQAKTLNWDTNNAFPVDSIKIKEAQEKKRGLITEEFQFMVDEFWRTTTNTKEVEGKLAIINAQVVIPIENDLFMDLLGEVLDLTQEQFDKRRATKLIEKAAKDEDREALNEGYRELMAGKKPQRFEVPFAQNATDTPLEEGPQVVYRAHRSGGILNRGFLWVSTELSHAAKYANSHRQQTRDMEEMAAAPVYEFSIKPLTNVWEFRPDEYLIDGVFDRRGSVGDDVDFRFETMVRKRLDETLEEGQITAEQLKAVEPLLKRLDEVIVDIQIIGVGSNLLNDPSIAPIMRDIAQGLGFDAIAVYEFEESTRRPITTYGLFAKDSLPETLSGVEGAEFSQIELDFLLKEIKDEFGDADTIRVPIEKARASVPTIKHEVYTTQETPLAEPKETVPRELAQYIGWIGNEIDITVTPALKEAIAGRMDDSDILDLYVNINYLQSLIIPYEGYSEIRAILEPLRRVGTRVGSLYDRQTNFEGDIVEDSREAFAVSSLSIGTLIAPVPGFAQLSDMTGIDQDVQEDYDTAVMASRDLNTSIRNATLYYGTPVVKTAEAQRLLDYMGRFYGIDGTLETFGKNQGLTAGSFSPNRLQVRINSQAFMIRSILDGRNKVKPEELISRRTIFHEYLHPFTTILKVQNPRLYNAMLDAAELANKTENFLGKDVALAYALRDPQSADEEMVVRYLDRLSDASDPQTMAIKMILRNEPKAIAKTLRQAESELPGGRPDGMTDLDLLTQYFDFYYGRGKNRTKGHALLNQFMTWMTNFFYGKRENRTAEMRALSPETTSEELYEMFENYGNMRADFINARSAEIAERTLSDVQDVLDTDVSLFPSVAKGEAKMAAMFTDIKALEEVLKTADIPDIISLQAKVSKARTALQKHYNSLQKRQKQTKGPTIKQTSQALTNRGYVASPIQNVAFAQHADELVNDNTKLTKTPISKLERGDVIKAENEAWVVNRVRSASEVVGIKEFGNPGSGQMNISTGMLQGKYDIPKATDVTLTVPGKRRTLSTPSLANVSEARKADQLSTLISSDVLTEPNNKDNKAPVKKSPKTGESITIEVNRNPEKAPKVKGDPFLQKVEPSGVYVTQRTGFTPVGWQTGQMTLSNPLVIPITEDTQISYKQELSDKYDGKTGAALSTAIKEAGYDSVVTVHEDGNTSEIIVLGETTVQKVQEEVQKTPEEVQAEQPAVQETDTTVQKADQAAQGEVVFTTEGGQNMRIATPAEYTKAIEQAKKDMGTIGDNVSHVSEDYGQEILDEGGTLLVSEDGKIGAYITGNGYAGGLWNTSEEKGIAGQILKMLREQYGVRFMESFGINTKTGEGVFLEKLYVKHGWRPVARVDFDPTQAVDNWEDHPEYSGRPDLVFYVYDPDNAELGAGERVAGYDEAYNKAESLSSTETTQVATEQTDAPVAEAVDEVTNKGPPVPPKTNVEIQPEDKAEQAPVQDLPQDSALADLFSALPGMTIDEFNKAIGAEDTGITRTKPRKRARTNKKRKSSPLPFKTDDNKRKGPKEGEIVEIQSGNETIVAAFKNGRWVNLANNSPLRGRLAAKAKNAFKNQTSPKPIRDQREAVRRLDELRGAMKKAGLSDVQIDSTTAVYIVAARKWAKKMNKPWERFFIERLAGVRFIENIDTLSDQELLDQATKNSKAHKQVVKEHTDFLKSLLKDPDISKEDRDIIQEELSGIELGEISPYTLEKIATSTAAGKVNFDRDRDRIRGAIRSLTEGRTIMFLTGNARVSTPLHELAHVFEQDLTEAERDTILKWAGHESWTPETSEMFAAGAEKFFFEGPDSAFVDDNPELGKVLEKFRVWLKDIFSGMTEWAGLDVQLTPEMQDLYESVYGFDAPRGTVAIVETVDNKWEKVSGVADKKMNKATFLEMRELFGLRSMVAYDRNSFDELLRRALVSGVATPKEAQSIAALAMSQAKLDAKETGSNSVIVTLTPVQQIGLSAAALTLAQQIRGIDNLTNRTKAESYQDSALKQEYTDQLTDINAALLNARSSSGLMLGIGNVILNANPILDVEADIKKAAAGGFLSSGIQEKLKGKLTRIADQISRVRDEAMGLSKKDIDGQKKAADGLVKDVFEILKKLGISKPATKKSKNQRKNLTKSVKDILDKIYPDKVSFDGDFTDDQRALYIALKKLAVVMLREDSSLTSLDDLTKAMIRDNPKLTAKAVSTALMTSHTTLTGKQVKKLKENQKQVKREIELVKKVEKILKANIGKKVTERVTSAEIAELNNLINELEALMDADPEFDTVIYGEAISSLERILETYAGAAFDYNGLQDADGKILEQTVSELKELRDRIRTIQAQSSTIAEDPEGKEWQQAVRFLDNLTNNMAGKQHGIAVQRKIDELRRWVTRATKARTPQNREHAINQATQIMQDIADNKYNTAKVDDATRKQEIELAVYNLARYRRLRKIANAEQRLQEMEEQIRDIEENGIKPEHLEEPVPTEAPVSAIRTTDKLRRLQKAYKQEIDRAREIAQKGEYVKWLHKGIDALHVSKSLVLSMDFSFIGIHVMPAMAMLARRNGKGFLTAMGNLFQVARRTGKRGDAEFDRRDQIMKADPRYNVAISLGLNLAEPEDAISLDEANTAVNLIDGSTNAVVKRFMNFKRWNERNYAIFLNSFRFEMAKTYMTDDKFVESQQTFQVSNRDAGEAAMRFINDLTGGFKKDRSGGSPGLIFNQATQALFISPRLYYSQFRTLGHLSIIPEYVASRSAIKMAKGKLDKGEATEAEVDALKSVYHQRMMDSLIGLLQQGITMFAIPLAFAMAQAGDDDEFEDILGEVFNPNNSNFGKVRIGKRAYNLSPLRSPAKLIGQIVGVSLGAAQGKNPSFDKTQEELAFTYLKYRLSPPISSLWNAAQNKDFLDRKISPYSTPLNPTNAIRFVSNAFLPIALQDIGEGVVDAVEKGSIDPLMSAASRSVVSILGVGVVDYDTAWNDISTKRWRARTNYSTRIKYPKNLENQYYKDQFKREIQDMLGVWIAEQIAGGRRLTNERVRNMEKRMVRQLRREYRKY